MSYHSEHQRMKPVLDLARKLDIASNPGLLALFEAGNSGFQVWCIPQDRPRGWSEIPMHPGSFSKPCQYVGSVHWNWEEEKIVGLEIGTTAFALADHKPHEYNQENITNREDDIAWLKEKVSWLFAEAGIPLPPFHVASDADSPAYVLAHYSSREEQYVVIVSADFHPESFCRPGFELVRMLGIGNAGLFPLNMILHPKARGRRWTLNRMKDRWWSSMKIHPACMMMIGWKLCAVKRENVKPSQRVSTGRRVLGAPKLPGGEIQRGK